jgi:hypothetical protein
MRRNNITQIIMRIEFESVCIECCDVFHLHNNSTSLLNRLITRLLCMLLSIMTKHPILPRELNQRRILLHLLPIGVMPHIPRRLTRLLHRLYTLIPHILVSPQRATHILLPSLPQQHRKRHAILQRLRRTLRTRRQEGMRRISQEADATVAWGGAVSRYPVGQRVPVYEFPIDEFCFGGLGHDVPAHGVPAVEDLFYVFEVAGERPGFVDVVGVAVREDPAAVCAVFDGAEEEVDVWACQ